MNYPYAFIRRGPARPRYRGIAIERYFVAYDIGKAVQSDADRRTDHGRRGTRNLAGLCSRNFSMTIARAALRQLRRLHDATAREIPPVDVLITEDAPSPLNHLASRRRRRWRQCRRRRDRRRYRRRAEPARRGKRAPVHAAKAAPNREGRAMSGIRLTVRVDLARTGRSVPAKIKLLETYRQDRVDHGRPAARSACPIVALGFSSTISITAFVRPSLSKKPGGVQGGGATRRCSGANSLRNTVRSRPGHGDGDGQPARAGNLAPQPRTRGQKPLKTSIRLASKSAAFQANGLNGDPSLAA